SGLADAPVNAVPFRSLDSKVNRRRAAPHEMSHRRVRQIISSDTVCQQPLLNFGVCAGAEHVPARSESGVKASDASNIARKYCKSVLYILQRSIQGQTFIRRLAEKVSKAILRPKFLNDCGEPCPLAVFNNDDVGVTRRLGALGE